MKYKVGDRFKAKPDMPAMFKTGKIIGIDHGGGYLIETDDHVDSDESTEPTIIIRRHVDLLDLYYEKVPEFYKVGKTYMFGDPASKTLSRYKIVELYQNETSKPWVKVQALAKATDSDGDSLMVILTSHSFNSAIEV